MTNEAKVPEDLRATYERLTRNIRERRTALTPEEWSEVERFVTPPIVRKLKRLRKELATLRADRGACVEAPRPIRCAGR